VTAALRLQTATALLDGAPNQSEREAVSRNDPTLGTLSLSIQSSSVNSSSFDDVLNLIVADIADSVTKPKK